MVSKNTLGQLDFQLPMQSVPITTDVMSSNLDQGEVYKIMWYSLSVTCDWSVVFSGYIQKIIFEFIVGFFIYMYTCI
jgi:hypothetical protein